MIDYHVSQDGQRINTFPKGVLNINETIDYFNRLTGDPAIKEGAVEIVDFKYVTDFKLSYVESKRITESYQGAKNKRLIHRTVFICETDMAYGIGRMLQTLHDIANPNHEVVLVRSKSELETILENS